MGAGPYNADGAAHKLLQPPQPTSLWPESLASWRGLPLLGPAPRSEACSTEPDQAESEDREADWLRRGRHVHGHHIRSGFVRAGCASAVPQLTGYPDAAGVWCGDVIPRYDRVPGHRSEPPNTGCRPPARRQPQSGRGQIPIAARGIGGEAAVQDRRAGPERIARGQIWRVPGVGHHRYQESSIVRRRIELQRQMDGPQDAAGSRGEGCAERLVVRQRITRENWVLA